MQESLTSSPVPTLAAFSGTVTIKTLISPFHDPQPELIKFLATAAVKGAKMRTIIYAATWAPFFDAAIAAKAAGADVKIIFDLSQSAGAAEQTQLNRLVAAGFVLGTDYLIGTSPVSHQIVHSKRTMISVPGARAVTEFGSWNYSNSASSQINDVNFATSNALGTYSETAFNILWTWITANKKMIASVPPATEL